MYVHSSHSWTVLFPQSQSTELCLPWDPSQTPLVLLDAPAHPLLPVSSSEAPEENHSTNDNTHPGGFFMLLLLVLLIYSCPHILIDAVKVRPQGSPYSIEYTSYHQDQEGTVGYHDSPPSTC